MPNKVWLEFDGDLTQINGKQINMLTVTDPAGKKISALKEYVGGARLTAELPKVTKTGRFTLSWRVVSQDGHPVTGSIYFLVSARKKSS